MFCHCFGFKAFQPSRPKPQPRKTDGGLEKTWPSHTFDLTNFDKAKKELKHFLDSVSCLPIIPLSCFQAWFDQRMLLIINSDKAEKSWIVLSCLRSSLCPPIASQVAPPTITLPTNIVLAHITLRYITFPFTLHISQHYITLPSKSNIVLVHNTLCYITFTLTLHISSHYLVLHLHLHYISASITLRSPINSQSDEEEMAERIQFGTERNKMDCRWIIKFNCAIFEQSHNFFP